MPETSVLVPVAVAMFYRASAAGFETWVQQRTAGPHQGQWEFPGGKIESGESPWQALVREIREETLVEVRSQGTLLGIFPHDYGERRVLLYGYALPWEDALASAAGMVLPLGPGSTGHEWQLPLLPANFTLVEHLVRFLYDRRHA